MVIYKRIYVLPLRMFSTVKILARRNLLFNKHLRNCYCTVEIGDDKKFSKILRPAKVNPDSGVGNVGEELAGTLRVSDVVRVLNSFYERPELAAIVREIGLDDYIVNDTKTSFRKYCVQVGNLPSDLHIILSDLISGHGHVLDLMPFFQEHATQIHPHLKFKEELSQIADLTDPAHGYVNARKLKRKLILHCGPTNSGKTHAALQRFFACKKGVYCAPLKLLAHEIWQKTSAEGIACDLITGDEKVKALSDTESADHVSCTVEMASTDETYDVAVIDEIQMLKDPVRGYAWTRALLGVAAAEVHMCGEESAVDFIEIIANKLDEELEIHHYKRLSTLTAETAAVEKFENIRDGDCIVCFSRKDIMAVVGALERLKIESAVVYGSLPPGTKIAQANKFNNPNNSCNVLVTTDAIGLGMNLNIRRIVFYSIKKVVDSDGIRRKVVIPVSLAQQIAGRAGRFNSKYPNGFVTTFHSRDLEILTDLLRSQPEIVRKAGLIPSCEQMEMFSYYLPHLTLAELIDIFILLTTLDDSLYFICDLSQFRELASKIDHLPIGLKPKYSFCSAPVNIQSTLSLTLFTQMAKIFSENGVVTWDYVKKFLNWPFQAPMTVAELELLEDSFDCLDLYQWFGYRFPLTFPDMKLVKAHQRELDMLILEGMLKLLKGSSKTGVKEASTKLEAKLLERGLLTAAILAELKEEWRKEMNEERNPTTNRSE